MQSTTKHPRHDSNVHQSITATGVETQTDTGASLKKCLNCSSLTSNPKFCNRSCAASYNNKKFPKRKLSSTKCKNCQIPISSGWTYCPTCRTERKLLGTPRMQQYRETTLDELRGTGNANRGGRYPYIRKLAQKVYKDSGRPLICPLCQYAVHVDVCHIKDIKSYSGDTPLKVVNAVSNLIALCKNHHWEFDNDLL